MAFLESLNLAHGDLRPENILLVRNQLKLSDFNCTEEVRADFEAYIAPYGRVLNSNKVDQGQFGTAGFLGPQTGQLALGSLYFFRNYGYEVYGNRNLTDNAKEHGPQVVELLQNMEFPDLHGDPLIDGIIHRCWHNKYFLISDLAAYTETLLPERIKGECDAFGIPGVVIGEPISPSAKPMGQSYIESNTDLYYQTLDIYPTFRKYPTCS